MSGGRRVLVTGGLGFIGSSLSERFLQAGWRVTIVDSLVSNVVEPTYFTERYETASVELASVQDFASNSRQPLAFDLAIHAASLVGPAGILAYAGTLGEQIVLSTSRLISYCTTRNVPLVYFSSAEVYGRSGTLDEGMDLRVPCTYNARLEYALGKLTCESMLINSRCRGLRTAIIRPFNVVGPRQGHRGGFVMPTLVQQALTGRPLTVFESGQQQRAFTDVDDVVEFVFSFAARGFDSDHPIYNVGNPANTTTVENLARRIKEILGASSEIVFTSGRAVHGPLYFEAESFHKIPAVNRAEALGWRPTSSLDQIIQKTATYYRERDQSPGRNVKRAAA